MNWLLKLLGYRDREYCGAGFSVGIEPVMREVVSVIYTRNRTTLNLAGEHIGKNWSGIEVHIPQEIEASQLRQIVDDLETAFQALRYGYVIARKAGVDIVPETEQQSALAELHDMGYEIEILPGRKVRQTWRVGAPRPDLDTLKKQTPRMMSLIQSVYGTRQRFEVLAKSKEFNT